MQETAVAKTGAVEIVIELDDGANFVYRPALLKAKPNDLISWRCDQGDFTVSFPERSPFGKVTIQGSRGNSTDSQRVRPDVEPRVYHYHVAVAVPTPNEKAKRSGEVRIFVDSGCPGIGVSASP
jgi:plastocyanin